MSDVEDNLADHLGCSIKETRSYIDWYPDRSGFEIYVPANENTYGVPISATAKQIPKQ